MLRSDGSSLNLNPNPSTQPQQSAVVLPPGSANAAGLQVYWSNWCSASPSLVHMQVTLPDNGGVVLVPFSDVFAPTCRDASQPSTLTVVSAYMQG
jgi:hypothetical protein